MFSRTLKTAALAAAVVIATAGASMAAQFAWVDQTAKVKANHSPGASTVNWVHPGQKVKIVASWGDWRKLQIPGNDGWVKKQALDNHPPFPGNWNNGGYGYGYGGSFCINGQNASFCLSGGY